MNIKTLKLCCAVSFSLMLAACGGGEGSTLDEQKEIINGSASNSSANAIGADTLQAIAFADAQPATLTLKGTGGAESSLVTFRVVGKTGLPIEGIKVNFVLNSAVGELTLSQTSNTSDKDGIVYTSVISGSVSTSVRVTATADSNPAISTQSSLLVVATGLPDQKSMSLAVNHRNPAGWRYNGVEAQLSVLLADAYNNPVADGTAVSFRTEGGSIESKCTTLNGGCVAKWTSQDPKPGRTNLDDSPARVLCLGITDEALLLACEAERAGRITILATAIGNESFDDWDGTGIFDAKDTFKTEIGGNCRANAPESTQENSPIACDDLSEAYLDKNESRTHESDEFFLNFITDKTNDLTQDDNYTPNNGKYNGAFCQPADELIGLCSRSSINIRKDIVIVMSCDYAYTVEDTPGHYVLPKVAVNAAPYLDTYALADCNGNSLPVGTIITLGANEPFTLGSAVDWMPFGATAGMDVKLEIPIGDTADNTVAIRNYITGP